jgi:hypothetical protein
MKPRHDRHGQQQDDDVGGQVKIVRGNAELEAVDFASPDEANVPGPLDRRAPEEVCLYVGDVVSSA